jgi:hypothetical protein
MLKLQEYALHLINAAAHTAGNPFWLRNQIMHRFCNASDTVFTTCSETEEHRFVDRTGRHIRTLNYLAQCHDPRLRFPGHDKAKLCNVIESYELSLLTNGKISTSQLSDLHQFTSPHHPQFWKKIQLMPDIKIIEMSLDWLSMSIEKNREYREACDETMNYYKTNALHKRKFTKHQQHVIENTFNRVGRIYNPAITEKIWER